MNYLANTACFFYSDSNRYDKLLECAINSFKYYHPDIRIIILNKNDYSVYHAVDKFEQALSICLKENIKKSIFLGADTITCARLFEFLDSSEDILATLDYPYQLSTEYVTTPDHETHLNADVLCINNLSFLYKICEITKNYSTSYYEQGALNQIIWNNINNYSYKIIDYPYDKSEVIYNVRSKGNVAAQSGEKPWHNYTNHWKVLDNKLYSHDKKQIKVFHYCEGLGNLDDSSFIHIINYWINQAFNSETKKFFKSMCNCGDFFDKDFNL
jgi:hypothetical protein